MTMSTRKRTSPPKRRRRGGCGGGPDGEPKLKGWFGGGFDPYWPKPPWLYPPPWPKPPWLYPPDPHCGVYDMVPSALDTNVGHNIVVQVNAQVSPPPSYSPVTLNLY